MTLVDDDRLDRLARGIAATSLPVLCAQSYGFQPRLQERKTRPSFDPTVPTGFDPQAAALFEASMDTLVLVASADGVLDEDERVALLAVILKAWDGLVSAEWIESMVEDLSEKLAADGIAKRARLNARIIVQTDHQRSVLKMAALIAYAFGEVSASRRDILERLACSFDLSSADVVETLRESKGILGRG